MEFFNTRVCQIHVDKLNTSVTLPYLKQLPLTGKSSRGSGFVMKDSVTSKKYIVTNHHVIAAAGSIRVSFPIDDAKVPTRVVVTDPQYDLALLEVPPQLSQYVEHIDLAPNGRVSTDTDLYAVGYPLGFEDLQIQQGRRTGYHITPTEMFIQHSAALNPGNSGGVLAVRKASGVGTEFEVVGINNAIIENANSVDFAILVDRLWGMLALYKQLGSNVVVLPSFFSGIEIQEGNDESRHLLGVDRKSGVRVKRVLPGSIAYGVLAEDDFLLEMDDFVIDDRGKIFYAEYQEYVPFEVYLSKMLHAEFVGFTIVRDCEELAADVQIQRKDPRQIKTVHIPYEKLDYELVSSVIIEDITRNAIDEFALNEQIVDYASAPGVVISLLPQGEIYASNQKDIARPGTIVTAVNGVAVDSLDSVRNAMSITAPLEAIVLKTSTNNKIILTRQAYEEDNSVFARSYGTDCVERFKIRGSYSDEQLEHHLQSVDEINTELTALEKQEIEKLLQ